MSFTQIITQLHTLYHQYSYLPLVLFLVALLVMYASFHGQKEQTRWVGYAAALVLVLCFIVAWM
jgi:hypothetical protein